LLPDNRQSAEFKSEWLGLLASATLSAITRFTIVHRTILSRLLTTRLVRRETDCANHGCQNGKQGFEIILHEQPSLVSVAKANQNDLSAIERLEIRYIMFRVLAGAIVGLIAAGLARTRRFQSWFGLIYLLLIPILRGLRFAHRRHRATLLAAGAQRL